MIKRGGIHSSGLLFLVCISVGSVWAQERTGFYLSHDMGFNVAPKVVLTGTSSALHRTRFSVTCTSTSPMMRAALRRTLGLALVSALLMLITEHSGLGRLIRVRSRRHPGSPMRRRSNKISPPQRRVSEKNSATRSWGIKCSSEESSHSPSGCRLVRRAAGSGLEVFPPMAAGGTVCGVTRPTCVWTAANR